MNDTVKQSIRPGRAGAAVLESQDVAAALARNYPEYQYIFVQFFTEHLADLSRVFDGDLSEMLVLAVLGQAYINEHHATASNKKIAIGMGASRLADVTGIPRETVRRKLSSLEKRGWIHKLNENAWTLSGEVGQSRARRDLEDVDRRSLQRVAQLFTKLSKLID